MNKNIFVGVLLLFSMITLCSSFVIASSFTFVEKCIDSDNTLPPPNGTMTPGGSVTYNGEIIADRCSPPDYLGYTGMGIFYEQQCGSPTGPVVELAINCPENGKCNTQGTACANGICFEKENGGYCGECKVCLNQKCDGFAPSGTTCGTVGYTCDGYGNCIPTPEPVCSDGDGDGYGVPPSFGKSNNCKFEAVDCDDSDPNKNVVDANGNCASKCTFTTPEEDTYLGHCIYDTPDICEGTCSRCVIGANGNPQLGLCAGYTKGVICIEGGGLTDTEQAQPQGPDGCGCPEGKSMCNFECKENKCSIRGECAGNMMCGGGSGVKSVCPLDWVPCDTGDVCKTSGVPILDSYGRVYYPSMCVPESNCVAPAVLCQSGACCTGGSTCSADGGCEVPASPSPQSSESIIDSIVNGVNDFVSGLLNVLPW